MVTTIVIFDVAPDAVRRRVKAVLHRYGFVPLFLNAMWGRCVPADRAALIASLRRLVSLHPHRILVLGITPNQVRAARWLIGSGPRKA
jgi:CRISPR-associated endonuclease Cas2